MCRGLSSLHKPLLCWKHAVQGLSAKVYCTPHKRCLHPLDFCLRLVGPLVERRASRPAAEASAGQLEDFLLLGEIRGQRSQAEHF